MEHPLNRTILLCRDYVLDIISDAQILHALQRRVICTVDDETARSHSGQTALLTLVALLVRMGMHVSVAAPDARLLFPQAPFEGETLHIALLRSSEQLLPDAMIDFEADQCADMMFIIGTGQSRRDVPCWWLTGAAWSGALVHGDRATPWDIEWPIGGMISALLAAGEAFKYAIRRLPLRYRGDRLFFGASFSCAWTFESVRLPQGPIQLRHVDVVSAGAIIQAALYSLLRLPRIEMYGRIFDDDRTAVSNLNRNMLTLVQDVRLPKVDIVARRCAPNILLKPVPQRFTEAHAPLASRVIVGVDDIPSRWEVQRHAPGWVGVSGTSHYSISSSAHQRSEACSACLHPIDDALPAGPIPTVAFISFWAGLSLAVRLVREALQQPYELNRQHLWLTPLQMDQPHAAMWSPVPPHAGCPAACRASCALTS